MPFEPRLRPPARHLAGTLCLALGLALGLAPTAAVLAAEISPVPTPSLADQPPRVRELITQARGAVEEARDAGGEVLGEAYGRLGSRYLHADRLDAAQVALENAVALEPTEVRWHYYLAVSLERRGELEAAAARLRVVLGRREGNLPAVLRLADLLTELGEHGEAEQLYRAALQSTLGVPAGRAGLARLAAAAGDHAAAVEHYRVALEAQPAATALHEELSHVLAAAGRRDEAQSELRQAGGVEVRYPDPLMLQLALEMGDPNVSLKPAGDSKTGGPKTGDPKAGDQATGAPAATDPPANPSASDGLAPAGDEPDLGALRRAVAERPADLEARRDLARALHEAGDTTAARETYLEILRLDPDDAAALLELGSLDFAAGDREDGLERLRQAVAKAPSSTEARLRLASALVVSEQLEEVPPHLEKAVELDPSGAVARLQLAHTYLRLGRLEEAEAQLAELLDRRPGHVEALLLRGQVAAAAGQPGPAEERFEEVLGLESATTGERARAAFNLGLLRQAARRIEEAVTFYRRALGLDPDHREALFNLALIMASNDRAEEAVALYTRLVDLEPENLEVRFRLAVLFMRRGEHWPALGHFEALLEDQPNHVEALVSSALLMARVGQEKQALERLGGAVERVEGEDRARLLVALGDLERAGGDEAGGLETLRRAVAADPGAAAPHLELARALAQDGLYAEAEEHFATYLGQRPDDESAHFARAMALILDDRYAAARDALAEVTARVASVPLTHLLARVLAGAPDDTVRDGTRAVEIARTVFERERSPAHGETLAMALAADGRFEEAITLQRRLLEEARGADVDASFIGRVERNLARFEAGRPGVFGW